MLFADGEVERFLFFLFLLSALSRTAPVPVFDYYCRMTEVISSEAD